MKLEQFNHSILGVKQQKISVLVRLVLKKKILILLTADEIFLKFAKLNLLFVLSEGGIGLSSYNGPVIENDGKRFDNPVRKP
jgi:hypothetical protein